MIHHHTPPPPRDRRDSGRYRRLNTGEDVLGHHFVEAEIEIPDPAPVATAEGRVV